MVNLITKIEKRLPENKEILKDLKLFNPNRISTTMFGDLPFRAFCPDETRAENEYRKLKVMDLNDLGLDEAGDIKPIQFWDSAANFEIEGEKLFSNISTYALNALSLPVSNAYVERVFSILTFMKDKCSNRMGLSMIDSLILDKQHLQAHIFAYLFRFFTWDIEIKFRFFEDEML